MSAPGTDAGAGARATAPAASAGLSIELRGVSTHNLRSLDVDVPHQRLTVVTGVSGSGKSSLAFDTLYAEGQRRFLESMSTYARQFLQRMEKPPLKSIANILPAVALRQRGASTHARSTVGTITELDDYQQMLFAHVGEQRCAACGELVQRDTVPRIVEALRQLGEGARLVFVADVVATVEEQPQHVLARLVELGYRRFWVDGAARQLEELDVEALLATSTFPVLIDRLVWRESSVSRAVEALDAGLELGGGRIRVEQLDGDAARCATYHRSFRCNRCHREYVEPIPALFNPNTTLGACPTCTGFGKTTGLDLRKVVPNPFRTLSAGAVAPFETPAKRRHRTTLLAFCRAQEIPLAVPWRELSEGQRRQVIEGEGRYQGVRGYFSRLEEKRRKPSARIMLARYRGYTTCADCGGARVCEQARHVLIAGAPASDLLSLTAAEALQRYRALAEALSTSERAKVDVLLEEIVLRLRYMVEVGLGYLRLDRQTRTLSGGELQRLQLTSSIGRALTDTLYVLDEPTAGLHARDSGRLLTALQGLRDLGNTVVVVEHDPEIIQGADWALEIGPGGGEAGGRLLYAGPVAGLAGSDTATGRMLSRRAEPRVDWRPADAEGPAITVYGATEHNLRDLTVRIPLHRLVCVTGVSGSGKSTLVTNILYHRWRALGGDTAVDVGACDRVEGFEHLDELVLMSQKLLGRSSRSNPATYTKAYDAIRKLLSETHQAMESGITPRHFSFNTRGGRCEVCEGTGRIVVEMQFMADVELQCDACAGRRFTDPVLAIRYRGQNIDDILRMTVREALAFFRDSRPVTRALGALSAVGLDYVRLGQTTSTLSGGELQRLKLASYVQAARGSEAGRSKLFIFDEPTVGLHLQDVEVLMTAIRQIVADGHTALVVEHNIDFIAGADHVLDLGPEGGDGGGLLVAEGTPEDIARCPASHTGRYLAACLGLGAGAAV